MDGRESMALSGSNSYYLNRGFSASASNSGSAPQTGGVPVPPGFEHLSNPNISAQSNSVGATFQLENSSPKFPHMVVASPGKKKRGRPRKYGPDAAHMSLALAPMSAGEITPAPEKKRGRPPGSGRKQQLASLGEWMNSSAGLAFTPHVIHIPVGEDIAGKILSFAQQRPRALCILSANGAVSTLTLRQPTSSDGTITYEGRFEILCLSGSYLLAESGGPRNRTGGLSISVCSPDGHIIGGGIGGRLIAASQIQVNVFSFVYGGSKTKNNADEGNKDDRNPVVTTGNDKASTPSSAAPNPIFTPTSSSAPNPNFTPSSRSDLRNPNTEIDLTSG